jgi:cell division protein FtsN
MIEIGTYPTRSDAEFAQARLASAGISSLIAADDARGASPARLLVDDVDADAIAVLSDQPTHIERST